MTVLWFFLVVSWTGDISAYHGFHGAEDCHDKRKAYVSAMSKTVRDITECIGVPVHGMGKK